MRTTQKHNKLGVQIGLAIYGLALLATLTLAGCHQTAACYQYSAANKQACTDCDNQPQAPPNHITTHVHTGEIALTRL